MTNRKNRVPVIKVAKRTAVTPRIHSDEPKLVDVATDPTLPLKLEMTAWETAFNAVVLLPMAIAMFVGAAPLVVANAFSRKPAAGVTI
jgi:hypothetical protein